MSHPAVVHEPGARPDSPILLTCEHATNLLPPGIEATAEDAPWLQTHWAWDPGAEALTRAIAAHFGAEALYSRFSRLVIDPNRARDQDGLVRAETEGHALSFNADLTEDEVERRWGAYHAPYHAAVDAAVAARVARGTPFLLFSVHTFTPVYMGTPREIEFGVLFDDHEELAHLLHTTMGHASELTTGLNVPYSGKNGLIYSAHRHGTTHDVPYLEIEARQDLLATPAGVEAVARSVCLALEATLPFVTGLSDTIV